MIKAYQLGRVSLAEAESHMIDLYDVSSLFVTKVIVELAIERLCSYSTMQLFWSAVMFSKRRVDHGLTVR